MRVQIDNNNHMVLMNNDIDMLDHKKNIKAFYALENLENDTIVENNNLFDNIPCSNKYYLKKKKSDIENNENIEDIDIVATITTTTTENKKTNVDI